ncbi:erythroblast NAD(P)(+)--arginine ADP-ribosyltransferase-like [Chiloscyllium plagiosum]|uniref:erythroblast NAD(P)(+)--arginine ADP-ribosyltransferase-like n=1 Tax=Chiloscyllium plagiosum TaxID=36176 RepID=UPI001CB849BE|nr:erythroblast NAD(P)(+)--arginine ADP-ribosyltransferase-like [Chiloscyllium plagiosum]
MEEELSSWLALLDKERELNPALDKAWSQAWLEWARMKEGGSRAPGGLRDELVVAVVCYALEYPPPPSGPLYLVFNQASRHCLGPEESQEACERFRGLHQLLGLALRGLRRAERAQGREGEVGTVYRGSPRPFWAKVGETVQFGSFTSTSASRDVAEIFAGGGGGSGGTLFHIRTARGASVEELSPFPQEKEVLIPPCEVFRVDKVERSKVNGQPRIDLHLTSLQLSGVSGPRDLGRIYLLTLTLTLTLAQEMC